MSKTAAVAVTPVSAKTAKTLAFLAKRRVPLRKTVPNKVLIRVDRSCDMAEVEVNGKCIMMGNFWDFHPGCHGFDLKFRGYEDLADLFISALAHQGKGVIQVLDDQWVYED